MKNYNASAIDTTAMALFVTNVVFIELKCSPSFNILQKIGLYYLPVAELLND